MRYKTDPANILRSVDIVFQVFAKAADKHGGLFPAVAERQNGQLLMDQPLPACIPGQRNSDRSPRGCNLQHDIGLLAGMHGLAEALDRPRYATQREAYLRAFATVCAPVSPTGLLPWGEHSYWDLNKGRIGNSYLLQYHEQPLDAGIETHHQLHPLPLRDWRTIHDANPDALPRFADGLDWHWQDDDKTQFNRHAPITQLIAGYQNKRTTANTDIADARKMGGDFPGAAGVFIHNYACALALADEPRDHWRQMLRRFSDSWWDRRTERGVCTKSGGKGPLSFNGQALDQTLSLAVCCLKAAAVLADREPKLSALLRERGEGYVQAILDFDQPQLDDGRLAVSFSDETTVFKTTQPWAGNRGTPSTAVWGLKLLAAAQAVGDDRGLSTVERAARVYHDQRLPRDVIVRAGDPGAVIALAGELHRLTGEARWLDTALVHATDAMELYFDSPLPRVALGRRHYEAQQGSGDLVRALARLVLIAEGRECVGGLMAATDG
jgi:hypothetical protein